MCPLCIWNCKGAKDTKDYGLEDYGLRIKQQAESSKLKEKKSQDYGLHIKLWEIDRPVRPPFRNPLILNP